MTDEYNGSINLVHEYDRSNRACDVMREIMYALPLGLSQEVMMKLPFGADEP
jgi:hypothetical protein